MKIWKNSAMNKKNQNNALKFPDLKIRAIETRNFLDG